MMRGQVDPQSHLFSYFSPEERVPAMHPLRSIKAYTESALKEIRPLLDTHASTTDPEAKLTRKSPGKEAKLCFTGHALMDNRHGLLTDVSLTPSVGVSEPEAALALLRRQRRKHLRPKSVGADKGFHTQKFVTGLRHKHIAPARLCANASSSASAGARALAAFERPACTASNATRS